MYLCTAAEAHAVQGLAVVRTLHKEKLEQRTRIARGLEKRVK